MKAKPSKSKKNGFRLTLISVFVFGVALFIFLQNEKSNGARLASADTKPAETPNTRSRSATRNSLENWRGAPVGDGEDTIDSYHSYDHRPPGNDPRDVVLRQYSVHPCPNNGIGTMVSGQDSRYYEIQPPRNKEFKERNPKFLCDIDKITESEDQPCVVYSFGSWDEISFEVGIDKVTKSKCEVHTFDPSKYPSQSVADKYNFKVHDMGISPRDNGKFKTLATIMNELGHSHIHIFKIDVEGAEQGVLPNLIEENVLSRIEQVAIEFHSVAMMKEGLDILEAAGFNIVFARREDRCPHCTEVTMARI